MSLRESFFYHTKRANTITIVNHKDAREIFCKTYDKYCITQKA